MTVFESIVLILLFLLVSLMLYLGWTFRNTLVAQQIDLNYARAQVDSLREFEYKSNEANIRAQEYSIQAINDRTELIELIQLIWDARDTEAASRCVKHLVVPGIDGEHHTIHDCHIQLRADLGIEQLEKELRVFSSG